MRPRYIPLRPNRDTPRQEPASSEVNRRRETIELDKLQAETEKVRLDNKFHRRQRLLELLKTFGALAAVVGVLLTFEAQRRQLARAERESSAKAFNDLITQFGAGESPQARLMAAAALSGYLSRHDASVYPTQVRDLFIASIPVERELSVRAFISATLERHANMATVAALAGQNRDLQKRLADIMEVPVWVIRRAVLQPDITTPAASKSSFEAVAADLEWNITTLIRVISSLREISDVDLSGITLNAITRISTKEELRKEGTFYFYGRDRQLPEGLVFRSVSLNEANLSGLNFEGAHFASTTLDRAILFRTHFWRCRFENVGARDFSPALYGRIYPAETQYRAMLKQTFVVPPFWSNSNLTFTHFYPSRRTTISNPLLAPRPIFYPSTFGGGSNRWFLFWESRWTILNDPPSSVETTGWIRSSSSARQTWWYEVASER